MLLFSFNNSTSQTRAECTPHPEWDKVVYFVCSSLEVKELPIGSQWDTQDELNKEAEFEVKAVEQLVQKYIDNNSPNGKADTSVCVMFPTRQTVSANGVHCLVYCCYR